MPRPATRGRPRAARYGTSAAVLASIVLGAARHPAGQAPAVSPAAPGQTAAGQAPTAQRPAPTFRLGASYVRVDVYPTRGGEPVQDLERASFELLEDGVPQMIDQFDRVSLQTTTDRDARRD